MSQAVQPQVGGQAVSTTNPMPVMILTGTPGAPSASVSSVEYRRFTSVAGNQTLIIAEGATEVSVANTGNVVANFSTASMGGATDLYPISTTGAELTLRAPQGSVLEEISVTAALGETLEYVVIR